MFTNPCCLKILVFTLNDRFVLNLGWKKYFFTVRPGMLDILLFLLYFPRFFFSLVTTVIVSYMLSACKGSEKIETRPPPNLRVWMTPPPQSPYPKVWIRRWPRWDYLLLPELKVSLKQNGAFYRVTMHSKFLHGQINFSFSIKCIQDARDCNNRRKVDDRFPCIMVTGLTGFSFCTRNFVFYGRQNLLKEVSTVEIVASTRTA